MNLTILPRSWEPILLSVLRIVTGLLFLEYGTAKILSFPPGLPFVDKLSTGMLYFTGIVEVIGGTLILIGLLTRLVAFVLSGYTAFAYFMVHFPMSFFPIKNGGESAIFFCFFLLYLSAAGPGLWAVDSTSDRAGSAAAGPPPARTG